MPGAGPIFSVRMMLSFFLLFPFGGAGEATLSGEKTGEALLCAYARTGGAPLDVLTPPGTALLPENPQYFSDGGASLRPEKPPLIFNLDPSKADAPGLLAALLEAGADPNAELRSESGGVQKTPLTHVMGPNHPAILVELLLKAGADPNRAAGYFTPLRTAVAFGRADVCALLLRAGADPNAGNAMGAAIGLNHGEIIDLLFHHGVNVKADGGALLLDAARGASPKVTKRLLEAGAVPDLVNGWGNTPLDIAETRDNEEEKEELRALLLAAGTPSGREIREKFYTAAERGSPEELAVLLRDNKPFLCPKPFVMRQALYLAVAASRESDRREVVAWLLAQGETIHPKVVLDKYAPPQILQLFVQAGAEVRIMDGIPSLFCVHWDKPNAAGLAKVLLDAGADPNALAPPKSLPFFMALFKGTPAAFLLFPLAQAVEEKDIRQRPLFFAATRGREEEITVLLDNGADIAAKDRLGFDVLFYAVTFGRTGNVNALLGKGANPNGKAVLEAAALTDPNLVRILLDKGANARSDEGFAALRRAVLKGAPESVDVLLRAGVDFRRKDAAGKSLLELARDRKIFFRQTPEGKAIESLLRAAGLQSSLRMK